MPRYVGGPGRTVDHEGKANMPKHGKHLRNAISKVEHERVYAPLDAVRLAKEAIQRGQDLDLDNACVLESDAFGLCFTTGDQREGMSAFLEKRKANFAGK